jgi:hypothetical protein
MNQADREKLDRLTREWLAVRDTPAMEGISQDDGAKFAYWLVRHSGWTVLPPGEPTEDQKLEAGAAFGSKLDRDVLGAVSQHWRYTFAGQALQGLLASLPGEKINNPDASVMPASIVACAMAYADALIAELDKETK